MASSSHFKLTSTATAVALVVPGHLQPDINSLRKLHDKAYRKWEPHINLLYPFVDPSQLPAAVSILRQHLLDHQHERLRIDLSQVDTFTHRRNATVFLKPSPDSEMSICQLRASMATSLGCDESEGTHDGTFRPHMTMGQASLAGLQLNRLSEKVEKLTGLAWQGGSVVVLKREPWGEMRAVEELPFGIDNDEKTNEDLSAWDGYKNCFSFAAASGWSQDMTNTMTLLDPRSRQVEMTVATYNLMADESAPSFVSRLPLIMDAIKSATESSYASLQVLCLQEVNDEMLPLLLAESYIQETYPYSSHSPSSLLLSHRNLVTLSSRPFKFAKVDFSEHHKCMLDIYLVDTPVRVVNVHLSSALTDESTTAKRRQMDMVTEFTSLSKDSSQRDVIVTGDFNLTSSSSTIQTALSRRIISPATAELVRKVIDSDIWNDAFVVYNKCDMIDEEVSEGEQGATFDRSTNPLAATSEPPIDRRPQRYDRVLFRKGGDVHVQQLERFGFPNDSGHCGSDHYGVCATLRIGNSKSDMYPPSIEPQNSDLEIVRDTRDVRPLVEPYLPRSADQQLREDALETLHRTLSKNPGLQDLILAPLGSYLMDTYFADSDVDVLAIGAVPSKVFFDYASAQLQELAAYDNDANEFKGVHLVNSLVSIIELSVRGIKFDLQYCQAPELIERYAYSNFRLLHFL
jgi:endonuclease/exonuclease/phosphatase family metal-dependent hydrolase/2'-5' RNA ligase